MNPIYAAGVAQTDHAARIQAAKQRKARPRPRAEVVDQVVLPVEPAAEAAAADEQNVQAAVPPTVAPPQRDEERPRPHIDIEA